ncbi:DUF1833 family protein [Chitiniphilus shinanonensis]|uniref:DUF1833 family protein n=1 Tax=Chitiniphilus shinanonensis TaxID=553088 RepID=UPI00304F006B
MNRSRRFQANVNAVSGPQLPLILVEIHHPQLAEPVRVVNDTQDLVSNGQVYSACTFEIRLPDDFDRRSPRAQLSVDNVGRELTQWLEASNGGAGATCRLLQVLREAPDVFEMDVTMDLTHLSVEQLTVSGELGFNDVFDLPAVAIQYRPETAPCLF